MSLVSLLPVRFSLFDRPARVARKPRHPQHRAIDEVGRQKTLRAGADLLIKGLRLQLDEQAAKHAEVIARIDERHGETVRGLEEQIAELQRRLNIGVLAESVVTRTQELSLEEIRKHCTTPVMPLHQAADAGLLGPVTNPGAVHTEGVA